METVISVGDTNPLSDNKKKFMSCFSVDLTTCTSPKPLTTLPPESVPESKVELKIEVPGKATLEKTESTAFYN